MLQHISNLRQALRFAVSDFKADELPGFCLPKKVSDILTVHPQGCQSSVGLRKSLFLGTKMLTPNQCNSSTFLCKIIDSRCSPLFHPSLPLRCTESLIDLTKIFNRPCDSIRTFPHEALEIHTVVAEDMVKSQQSLLIRKYATFYVSLCIKVTYSP